MVDNVIKDIVDCCGQDSEVSTVKTRRRIVETKIVVLPDGSKVVGRQVKPRKAGKDPFLNLTDIGY